LLIVLKVIEKRGALDLVGRVRQRLVGIMRTAVQLGLIDSNPANDLQGATATRKVMPKASACVRLPAYATKVRGESACVGRATPVRTAGR
jgi:homoserine dehydrogenase